MTRSIESRPLTMVVTITRRVGYILERVTCPFCGTQTYTYKWSRWGSGKKCSGDCNAVLHGTYATSVRGVVS